MKAVKVLIVPMNSTNSHYEEKKNGNAVYSSFLDAESVLSEYLNRGYELKTMSQAGGYMTFVLEKDT